MTINAKISRYNATALGVLNNSPFRLSGSGQFDLRTGRVEGLYEVEQLPHDIDRLFFNAVLITGYPSVCKVTGPARNPFKGESYSYRRRVSFKTGERIQYDAICRWNHAERHLDSRFEVDGTLPVAKLESSLPLIEDWRLKSPSAICGSFAMIWRCRDGSELIGLAETVYSLPRPTVGLPERQKRNIRLTNAFPSALTFTVDQVSDLCVA